MRVSAILTLAFAAYASACASYNDCHCYDSNGVPNNGATKSVCDHFGGSMIKAEREYGASTTYQECEVKTYCFIDAGLTILEIRSPTMLSTSVDS
ncbi:hypothetical protein K4K55_007796 [Colletotrichum sp. SAR 10_96]|nr:hypothetical protein K4K55_007796 [Colletotrichum sp. SAR 10_96]